MAIKKNQTKTTIIVIVLLIFLVSIVKVFKSQQNPIDKKQTKTTKVDKRLKDFRNNEIELTEHAKCRMACRNISMAEIKEVLLEGKINYGKSTKNSKPCSKYALEDYANGKHLRVVVGDCNHDAVIITVIDLDNQFKCDCPGDEKN
jgi:hypothetical protein